MDAIERHRTHILRYAKAAEPVHFDTTSNTVASDSTCVENRVGRWQLPNALLK